MSGRLRELLRRATATIGRRRERDERLHALEAAHVVVVPWPYESLSLLALEAFAVGTPVLANARSEVLVDHCRRSNAGLFYEDRWESGEALNLLMHDRALADAMGRR